MVDRQAPLLTWTAPSGYAPDGRLVPEDVGGFSAYVGWLEAFIGSRKARRHLGARELQVVVQPLTTPYDPSPSLHPLTSSARASCSCCTRR